MLLTSDWHIKKRNLVWSKHPEIQGDFKFALDQIVQILNDRGLKHILLLGDIFDTKSQQSLEISLVRSFIRSCMQIPVKVLFVQGQHDLSIPPLLSSLHTWAIDISETVYTASDIPLYGLNYAIPQEVEGKLKAVPADTVLATHQVWMEFMGAERGFAALDMLPDSVNLVLTGDFHQQRNDSVYHRRIVNPGPICPTCISEIQQEHGVFILLPNLSLEWVPLKGRLYHTISAYTEEELALLCSGWKTDERNCFQEGVPDEISKPVIRFRYNQSIDRAASRLLTTLGKSAYLFLEPFWISEQAVEVQACGQAASFNDLIKLASKDKTLAEFASRLWLSENVASTIDDIVTSL